MGFIFFDCSSELNSEIENKRTLRATASANQTFANQLTYLQTAFNSLTDDEKMNSILVRADALILSSNTIQGQFSNTRVWNNGGSIDTMNIVLSTYYNADVSSTLTFHNSSNETDDATLKLYA